MKARALGRRTWQETALGRNDRTRQKKKRRNWEGGRAWEGWEDKCLEAEKDY